MSRSYRWIRISGLSLRYGIRHLLEHGTAPRIAVHRTGWHKPRTGDFAVGVAVWQASPKAFTVHMDHEMATEVGDLSSPALHGDRFADVHRSGTLAQANSLKKLYKSKG